MGHCRHGATAAWNRVQVGLLKEMHTPPTFLAHYILIEDTWTDAAQQPGGNYIDAGQQSILLLTQTPSAEDKT